MSKRFGRNQKAKMRNDIAVLEQANKSLRADVLKTYPRQPLIQDWIEPVVQQHSNFNRDFVKSEFKRNSRVFNPMDVGMKVDQSPYLDQLRVIGFISVDEHSANHAPVVKHRSNIYIDLDRIRDTDNYNELKNLAGHIADKLLYELHSYLRGKN